MPARDGVLLNREVKPDVSRQRISNLSKKMTRKEAPVTWAAALAGMLVAAVAVGAEVLLNDTDRLEVSE